MAEDYPSIRILVVGDSGVGKSSLMHMYCHGKRLRNPAWTTGCEVWVKLHQGSSSPLMVEFCDVGGNKRYSATRSVFYSELDGVILVYDLTNKASYRNLRSWIREVKAALKGEAYDHTCASGSREVGRRGRLPSGEMSRPSLGTLPALVIGNKKDKVAASSLPFDPMRDLHLKSFNASAFTPLDEHAMTEFFHSVVEFRSKHGPRGQSLQPDQEDVYNASYSIYDSSETCARNRFPMA